MIKAEIPQKFGKSSKFSQKTQKFPEKSLKIFATEIGSTDGGISQKFSLNELFWLSPPLHTLINNQN